jgi:hypothetical protein
MKAGALARPRPAALSTTQRVATVSDRFACLSTCIPQRDVHSVMCSLFRVSLPPLRCPGYRWPRSLGSGVEFAGGAGREGQRVGAPPLLSHLHPVCGFLARVILHASGLCHLPDDMVLSLPHQHLRGQRQRRGLRHRGYHPRYQRNWQMVVLQVHRCGAVCLSLPKTEMLACVFTPPCLEVAGGCDAGRCACQAPELRRLTPIERHKKWGWVGVTGNRDPSCTAPVHRAPGDAKVQV